MTAIPHTLKHAIHNPVLTAGNDLKVLTELHESLNVVEFRAVKPWYIAELLKIGRSSVQEALTHLVDLGYLERGDKNGNGYTFRLSVPRNGENSPPPLTNAA